MGKRPPAKSKEMDGHQSPVSSAQQPQQQFSETLLSRGVQSWTPGEVAQWVNFITNTETNGEHFIQQEIDGSSLVLLTCEQLKEDLQMKLGPAVKLNHAIKALKRKSSKHS